MVLRTMKSATLDSFDRKLLECVRRNNLEPARSLAEKVGLSESSVLRRLRRMRAEGIIIGDIALIDPALTGGAITMHVLVQLYNDGHIRTDAFARNMARREEVVAAWNVAGDDDFVLIVQVPSMEAYDAFTREELSEQSHVRDFKTLISIRPVVDTMISRRPLRA
nr:AsnC family transcriptional regulator [Novosphingobium sp. P6W]